jgi:hypothetical protein
LPPTGASFSMSVCVCVCVRVCVSLDDQELAPFSLLLTLSNAHTNWFRSEVGPDAFARLSVSAPASAHPAHAQRAQHVPTPSHTQAGSARAAQQQSAPRARMETAAPAATSLSTPLPRTAVPQPARPPPPVRTLLSLASGLDKLMPSMSSSHPTDNLCQPVPGFSSRPMQASSASQWPPRQREAPSHAVVRVRGTCCFLSRLDALLLGSFDVCIAPGRQLSHMHAGGRAPRASADPRRALRHPYF